MASTDTEVSMGFTGETFPPGIHMCFIYNDEDERKGVILHFLKNGLLNREKVSYFADMNSTDELQECRSVLGVDKLYEEAREHFSLATAREAYYPTGIFLPDETLGRLSKFYTQSINEGYAGARATAEMSWVKRGVPGSHRLMEYEAHLNQTLIKYPITAICQYNAKRFDNRMLRDVLAVHPMIIFHGRILKNPYYIKSWWLLKKYLRLNEESIPVNRNRQKNENEDFKCPVLLTK